MQITNVFTRILRCLRQVLLTARYVGLCKLEVIEQRFFILIPGNARARLTAESTATAAATTTSCCPAVSTHGHSADWRVPDILRQQRSVRWETGGTASVVYATPTIQPQRTSSRGWTSARNEYVRGNQQSARHETLNHSWAARQVPLNFQRCFSSLKQTVNEDLFTLSYFGQDAEG